MRCQWTYPMMSRKEERKNGELKISNCLSLSPFGRLAGWKQISISFHLIAWPWVDDLIDLVLLLLLLFHSLGMLDHRQWGERRLAIVRGVEINVDTLWSLSLFRNDDEWLDWDSDLNFLLLFSCSANLSALASFRFNLDDGDGAAVVEVSTTRVGVVDWTIVRLGEEIGSARTTFRLTTNRDWAVLLSSDFRCDEGGITLRPSDFRFTCTRSSSRIHSLLRWFAFRKNCHTTRHSTLLSRRRQSIRNGWKF